MSHPELKTIRDLLRWGASSFNQAGLTFGHGTDNVFDEALVLVSHALHLPLQFPEHYLGAHVTAEERDAALALIQQRIETRKPSAYLTHEAWFAGLPFYVDERVLVPRSPLAERIERGFELYDDRQPLAEAPHSVIDQPGQPLWRKHHHQHQDRADDDIFVVDVKQEDGDTIEVSYELSGRGDCDCMCANDIFYTLHGVESGTWTIDAEGVTTTIEVE